MLKKQRYFLILTLTVFFLLSGYAYTFAELKAEYDISFEANYITEEDIGVLAYSGSSSLPDGTLLDVLLNDFHAQTMGASRAMIQSGVYFGKLYVLDFPMLPDGEYICEVRFVPKKQTNTDVIRLLGKRGEKISGMKSGSLVYNNELEQNEIYISKRIVIGDVKKNKEVLALKNKKISFYVRQLDKLYNEIIAKYETLSTNDEIPNKSDWMKFSINWSDRLARIRKNVSSLLERKDTPYYENIYMESGVTVNLLMQLHNVYSAKILDEDIKPAFAYATETNPEILIRGINSNLTALKSKIN